MSEYRGRGGGGFHHQRGAHRQQQHGGRSSYKDNRGGGGGRNDQDDGYYDRNEGGGGYYDRDSQSNSQQQDSTNYTGTNQVVQQKLSLAVVCASNQNRSMSAHYLLSKKYGMAVSSFGTGSSVKLPGKTRDTPNIYDFGTPYQRMFDDLKQQDEEFYTNNGLLKMLTRNAQIKAAPEKWQENTKHFDVVVTFELRVFEAVIDSIASNNIYYDRPIHVINLEVIDNHKEAERNAKTIAEFVKHLNDSNDWENDITQLIADFEKKHKQDLMHLVLFA
ncbi:hypothetical protein C9374_000945 [Naegleria lovaniensis]|uniref:RNA polymerase II subunit A C-terminal domain phosphatase SSU72 n=1 Tax=Naegleria lovaniensis TaxID=51637 RepID=A0AA88GW69_NAELO|nr:uncharacterized protein C9374_000945 [Naegleria lovaniensis]KAG2388095.1 hypothetical protein C9374_000945 [Naegleria lovaniensis]